MKINLGSHSKTMKGYINVDGLDLEGVDIVHDLNETPYPFQDNSADEIVMIEVLEHISWRNTDRVLKECYRILAPGGTLHIQVPDCGSMMYCYICNAISDKIPHKGDKLTILKAQRKHNCIVHPDRWLMAFCGAQKHKFDAHLNIFTKDRMEEYLENAGFNVNFIQDPLQWKIICKAKK